MEPPAATGIVASRTSRPPPQLALPNTQATTCTMYGPVRTMMNDDNRVEGRCYNICYVLAEIKVKIKVKEMARVEKRNGIEKIASLSKSCGFQAEEELTEG